MENTQVHELAKNVGRVLREGKPAEAVATLQRLHPADRAEVFCQLQRADQNLLLTLLSPEEVGEILEYLDEEDRKELTARLELGTLSRVLDEVDSDVAADVLHDLPRGEAEQVLGQMKERADVERLLPYADTSAGGLMMPVPVVLRPWMTAQDAINLLRREKPDTDIVYYLFVIDENDRLVGVVSLRQLVIADPDTPIGQIMDPQVVYVGPDTDQEEVARLMEHYDLLALPVVDRDRRLLGMVLIEDVVDVIEEEATEDMFRMVGLSEEERALGPVSESVRLRLPWLVVNLYTAFLAGWVVSFFEDSIAKVAALAAIMPIISGQGGNDGIQTVTVIIRSLALGEVGVQDVFRLLRKQVLIALANGTVIGSLTALTVLLWKGNFVLAVVAAAAMVLNMLVAGFFGVIIPITLKLLRRDPAQASGVILTTFTDVCGFFIFLGLATMLLGWIEAH
ncbi:MAG: magnesium transporter [Chloroflexota bacterium]